MPFLGGGFAEANSSYGSQDRQFLGTAAFRCFFGSVPDMRLLEWIASESLVCSSRVGWAMIGLYETPERVENTFCLLLLHMFKLKYLPW